MGGLLHLFDFNPANMARKQKKHGGGLEPPRNSLDLPVESLQNYYGVEDCTLNSYEDSLLKKTTCSADASMKKLINEEMTHQRNSKQNGPSIVARLMGMDLPTDPISAVHPLEKNANIAGDDLKKRPTQKVSPICVAKRSRFYRPRKSHSSHDNSHTCSIGKFQPRTHPQEKELQMFKKEFEAWQAARFIECARLVELGNIPEQWLAQLDLNKEKMAFYENARKAIAENDNDLQGTFSKSRSLRGQSFQSLAVKNESPPSVHKESYFSKNYSSGREFEQLSLTGCDRKPFKAPSSTRIVLLKPGPESFGSNNESWVSSTASVEDRDSLEDLLEEVKEKLKCELQGKPFIKGSMVRGGGIETPFKEVPSPSTQVAQHIAKQARENVTRNLLQSDSPRSYRSEIQIDQPGSPYMSGDTRSFLSERLRNVLSGENNLETPNLYHRSPKASVFFDARETLEQARNILNAENGKHYWNEADSEQEAQARSFRQGFCDEGDIQNDCSRRNLVRSLSAPVSGASFGRLLLEDRHVLTGAQIRRKHEVLENMPTGSKSLKRERFNFREKVSNIRYSLKGRLFSRKFQSVDLSQKIEFDFMKNIESEPTAVNCRDRHDNFTEVPPSPASVCSGGHEELWKPADYSSPISASDVTSVGDNSVGNVFREISSNLSELRRQLNQLECDESEVTTVSEEPLEDELVDMEDEAEAYVRDLLVASGLYDGSSDKSFFSWDPLLKPISNWVFEKVEESYKKIPNEISPTKAYDETDLQHRLLFDLLNEALLTVLAPPKAMLKFRRGVIFNSLLSSLRGMKLLERVWKIIQEHLYRSADQSYVSHDDIVAHDLHFTPWFCLIDEHVNDLGKELECQIIGDLIDGVLKEFR